MTARTLPEELDHPLVTSLLKNCLAEDLTADGEVTPPLSRYDLTSRATLPENSEITATLFAKEDGVVAGTPLLGAICHVVDEELDVALQLSDGARVAAGDVVLTITGNARSVFTAERPALNLMGHCSGIATLARQFVDAVEGTGATILDTRKTSPGLRRIEKYAVRQGGAENHRMGLFDMVLIKDNHIAAAGSIERAVSNVRTEYGDKYPVEVEVSCFDELHQALAVDVDRIMLDNMNLTTMRRAVEEVNGAVPLEASGNVTLQTVRQIAETGVDFISVGALTHSATALDLSLRVQ